MSPFWFKKDLGFEIGMQSKIVKNTFYVNLIKIKSDTADKMSKVADLMTRIKLKEKDTFPRYLAAQQNNKVVIEGSKRDLLKSINKITSKKGESK